MALLGGRPDGSQSRGMTRSVSRTSPPVTAPTGAGPERSYLAWYAAVFWSLSSAVYSNVTSFSTPPEVIPPKPVRLARRNQPFSGPCTERM
jgi:hypothetical protein